MKEKTETRLDAIENMLGHLLLMLETEPRFTAARMGKWLRMTAALQPANKARTDALLALWDRIKWGAE